MKSCIGKSVATDKISIITVLCHCFFLLPGTHMAPFVPSVPKGICMAHSQPPPLALNHFPWPVKASQPILVLTLSSPTLVLCSFSSVPGSSHKLLACILVLDDNDADPITQQHWPCCLRPRALLDQPALRTRTVGSL